MATPWRARRPASPGYGPIGPATTGSLFSRRRAPGSRSGPSSPAPGSSTTFDEQWLMGLVGNAPPSLESLLSLEDRLKSFGVSIAWNARRTGADIRLPSGEIVDVIQGLEGPAEGRRWQWLPGGTGGAGEGTGAGWGGTGTETSLLDSLRLNYGAAFEAMRRQRRTAGAGGRRSTIYGGFRASSAPPTVPSMLGGY